MLNLRIKRKTDFYLSLSLFLFIVISMSTKYAGIGFPKESSLSYTTGILNLYDSARNTKHIEIYTVGENKERQVFACGYSVFGNGENSGCGSTRFYAPYINKEVTVGYYKQRKLLWFKNDMPQLVTMQTGDKVIESYATTAEIIRGRNKGYIFMIFFALPLSLFMYWAFGTLHKRGK